MPDRSKLISMKLRNLGCIGPNGLEVPIVDSLGLQSDTVEEVNLDRIEKGFKAGEEA